MKVVSYEDAALLPQPISFFITQVADIEFYFMFLTLLHHFINPN